MKIQTGRFIRSAVSKVDLLEDGYPQIAFVGRSNVGKSSLLNRLLGRRSLARISSKPGRTQAVNYFLINSSFYFVDLPGFGYAKVSKKARREWAELMDHYFNCVPERTQVVQLVDAKVGATPLDCEAADYFHSLSLPTTVVATKIDKVPRSKRGRQLKSIRSQLQMADEAALVPFSAVKGDGVSELWREVQGLLQLPSAPSHASRGVS